MSWWALVPFYRTFFLQNPQYNIQQIKELVGDNARR